MIRLPVAAACSYIRYRWTAAAGPNSSLPENPLMSNTASVQRKGFRMLPRRRSRPTGSTGEGRKPAVTVHQRATRAAPRVFTRRRTGTKPCAEYSPRRLSSEIGTQHTAAGLCRINASRTEIIIASAPFPTKLPPTIMTRGGVWRTGAPPPRDDGCWPVDSTAPRLTTSLPMSTALPSPAGTLPPDATVGTQSPPAVERDSPDATADSRLVYARHRNTLTCRASLILRLVLFQIDLPESTKAGRARIEWRSRLRARFATGRWP